MDKTEKESVDDFVRYVLSKSESDQEYCLSAKDRCIIIELLFRYKAGER